MYSLRKGAPGGAKSATACIMSLRVAGAGAAEIILEDFNLAVSTPTAKPPNLNPHQISRSMIVCYTIVHSVTLTCVTSIHQC